MKPIDSLFPEPEPTTTNAPTSFRLLSDSGFIHTQMKRPAIELAENKDAAEPLPKPIPFAEGTCEC